MKQGLGSSAHSVAINVKQDRAKVQALDVLHHLGHNCQLQSLQLSSDCTSGIRLLNAAAALTSLTELKLIHFKVASGEFEVRQLLPSPPFHNRSQWLRGIHQSVSQLYPGSPSDPELAGCWH